MERLDQVEARVVGSLVEKQLTTPQQYPLSLNSLVLACNQTSNRHPVVTYSEGDVTSALHRLKQKSLVRFVLPSHGRSVVRYRHVLDEKFGLDTRQVALLAVLMLRGPQTVGELRTRTDRMAEFAGLAEVESDMDGLSRWPDPLVLRLPRRPGQKEERWQELLSEPRSEAPTSPVMEVPVAVAQDDEMEPSALEQLRQEVAALREEVFELRLELESLRAAADAG